MSTALLLTGKLATAAVRPVASITDPDRGCAANDELSPITSGH
jgi:hypothetical protein